MATSAVEMKRVSTYDQLAAKDVEGQRGPQAGGKTPCNLSWSNIEFTVAGKAGKDPIKVLDKVWGSAKSGEVVCVMGASGAGKSSLLNVLAGRSATGGNVKISGSVTVNGKEINPQAWRSNVAYVMQDDALMMTATPREALSFSASLRLPQTVSKDEIKKLVDKTIVDLALESCADTYIGGPLMKGISGGQRKRVSVGVEIITNPSLLFLDEPTSGLDSFSAYNCIALLKNMAVEQNTTVLCTIHQPSSEVFFKFDRCIFMRGGRIFYQGATQAIVQHFSALGEPCPLNYNPSDFVMSLTQVNSMEECEKRGMMMDCPADFKHEGPSATWALVDDVKLGEGEAQGMQPADLSGAVEVFNNGGAGFAKQLYFLCEREVQNICRDYGALIGRYGVTIFLNVLFGIIFLNSGGQDDSIRTNANGHFGSLTMVTIASMFGCAQPVMLLFPFERPLFLREYSTGTYGGGAYFLSKTMCELPLTFVQSLVQYVICYFMCNFQGNFIYMVLAAWGLGAASASVATCLGSAVPDVKTVTELAPLLFVPQLLFAGFFVQTSKIPEVLRWAQWLCGIKYGMNLLILTEFNPALESCQGGAASFCRSIIDENDIKEDAWWNYILILVALFLAFRVLGAVILVDRAKTFY